MNASDVAAAFREGSGRAVAALIRMLGDIDVAEDAVQDAFAIALETWPSQGTPPEPTAWIIKTGRNRAIDRLRRESLGRALLSDAVREQADRVDAVGHGNTEPMTEPMDDDQLRLIFTCCHPSLAEDAQVALTLRLLCGLETRDVARAFLTRTSTMAQRLIRAKRKIKAAHIPYRVPEDEELGARVPPVLAVIYLVYNQGASTPPTNEGTGGDLTVEGIRLARLLHALMPKEQEVAGLLALLLLSDSRRPARFAPGGTLVLLRDQERGRWDRSKIEEGQSILRSCLAYDDAGPYQIQAALQAVHSDAASIEATDWPQIVALYDELLHMTGSAVVALNRAIAVAEVEGPERGLSTVDALELYDYYLFHSTRADLLRRLGRQGDAAAAYRAAAERAPTPGERAFLGERADEASAGA